MQIKTHQLRISFSCLKTKQSRCHDKKWQTSTTIVKKSLAPSDHYTYKSPSWQISVYYDHNIDNLTKHQHLLPLLHLNMTCINQHTTQVVVKQSMWF